jgi:hypothetical protein
LKSSAAIAGVSRVTTKTCRHTYWCARLASLDRGEPVSLDTVRRELGHGDEALVRSIYGHLGTIRHRAPVVEYRTGQHLEVLGDKLPRLKARAVAQGKSFGTTTDTAHRCDLAPSVVDEVAKSHEGM